MQMIFSNAKFVLADFYDGMASMQTSETIAKTECYKKSIGLQSVFCSLQYTVFLQLTSKHESQS